jgi:pantothenate synthetase
LRDAVHLATSTDARADDRLLVAALLGETRLIDNCNIGGG